MRICKPFPIKSLDYICKTWDPWTTYVTDELIGGVSNASAFPCWLFFEYVIVYNS